MKLPIRSSCTACDLHEVAESVGTPSLHLPDSLPPSPSHPAVVFIGRNPGQKEDAAGLPFVGPSGILVRGGQMAGKHVPGVYVDAFDLRARTSVYVTNTVRCFTAANAEPTNPQCTACFPHLQADLCTILSAHHPAPSYLVLLGGLAVAQFHKRLLGKRRPLKDAMSFNGKKVYLTPPDLHSTLTPTAASFTCYLYHTFHPAYLLRSPNHRPTVVDHLRLLSDHLSGHLPSASQPNIQPPRPPRPRN